MSWKPIAFCNLINFCILWYAAALPFVPVLAQDLGPFAAPGRAKPGWRAPQWHPPGALRLLFSSLQTSDWHPNDHGESLKWAERQPISARLSSPPWMSADRKRCKARCDWSTPGRSPSPAAANLAPRKWQKSREWKDCKKRFARFSWTQFDWII